MNKIQDLVAEAMAAVEICSLEQYTWFGRASARQPARLRAALGPETVRSYLVSNLSLQLYRDFYCVGRPVPGVGVDSPLWLGVTQFVEQLSEANLGAGFEEQDWTVMGSAADELLIRKGALVVRIAPGELNRIKANDPWDAGRISPKPGMLVSVRMPKEFFNRSPGFYMGVGDAGEERSDGSSVRLRLYLNLSAAGAIRFLREATRRLNAAGLVFRCKVANDPSRYTRCDAVVLYVRADDYGAVRAILEDLHFQLRGFLGGLTPVFTKRLTAGIGLAEDPLTGGSFGLHRCSLLAEAMIEAWEQHAETVEERLAVVDRRFAVEGLEIATSFLNPGSTDRYGFAELATRDSPPPRRSRAGNGVASADLLQTAEELGRALVRAAIWHEDRCTWISVAPASVPETNTQTFVHAGLGADLYAGTSGVGLFLASLATATRRHGLIERTAKGAVRHALCRVERDDHSLTSGLYTGQLGILVAAVLVGRLLDWDESVSRARSALKRIMPPSRFEEPSDLLAGRAGAIISMLVLDGMLADSTLVDAAASLGDALIESAEIDRDGWSWRSASHPQRQALTGFAHGAAGIGCALVELFAATGEDRYRRGAQEAFRYERRWFDPKRGNWLDLREEARTDVDEPGKIPCASHWCHGAPGVALSRARAYEVLRDSESLAEARIAAATTQRTVEKAIRERRGNFSLCHGMSGNAEVLLMLSDMLDADKQTARSIAYDVAAAGIGGYTQSGLAWPCGSVGESPGLMLGLAGIGYFYLRLHDLRLPSVLMPSLRQP